MALIVDFSKSASIALQGLTSNYWEIYNTFRNRYPDAELEIAMIGYSRTAFESENNYVQIISDFGDNPQKAFEFLFQNLLGSSIAQNNVGHALKVSINDLKWDKDANVKKTIITIGNGPIKDNYSLAKKMCKKANKLGIEVNALYILFKQNDKNFGFWMTLTKMSGGDLKTVVANYLIGESNTAQYQNQVKIINQNAVLNSTCIPYGLNGEARYDSILNIDSICKETGTKTLSEWIIYKTTSVFQSEMSNWDLVDLYNQKGVAALEKLNMSLLPKAFASLNREELIALVRSKSEERVMSLQIINMLNQSIYQINKNAPSQPAYKMNICQTILKMLLRNGI